jgi:hypothetical protein
MELTSAGTDVAGTDASGVLVHDVDSTYGQPEGPIGLPRVQRFHLLSQHL